MAYESSSMSYFNQNMDNTDFLSEAVFCQLA